MQSLPIFVKVAGKPVILAGQGDAAAAKRRLLERAGAVIVSEEAQALLAVVAIEDDFEAGACIARLRARGILVNAVDRPGSCDFTLPAIVDRDPVLIAVGTGGASAGLAKALRLRLEALLPANLGQLATAMSAARGAIRKRWPDADDRRRAIDRAFDPGGALDPMIASGDVDLWLAEGEGLPPRALVRFSLTSEDPDQLTLEQARWMARADTVYHAPDVAPAILDRARADARRIEWAGTNEPEPDGLSVFLTTVRAR